MSPELYDLVRTFFEGLVKICPTYIVVGNHDLNLSNPDRLDALSPVIKAMNNPDLHYLFDSGVYQVGNVCLHHLSRIGSSSNWEDVMKADNSDGNIHVGIYHGIVKGAVNNQGFSDFPSYIQLDTFDNFDITLLGDVHKRQFLDDDKKIAYAGSLIQQDFGEEVDKGYLLWDMSTLTAKFVKVENDYAFVTVDFDGDKPNILAEQMPERVRLRLRGNDVDENIISEYVSSVKDKSHLHQFRNEITTSATESEVTVETDELTKTRDTNVQMKLIREYLSDYDITDDVWKSIENINNDLNARLGEVDDRTRGIRWKPLRFEFSNMFAYGENNIVDFRNFAGIIGLFAPNASGKSALLDSILFCIFDKCSKTNSADKIMNNKSDEFYCKLDFQIGDDKFFIERHAKRKSNGSVSVSVNFRKIGEDDLINLDGSRRSETNKIIQEYLGTYDDFVLTTFSTQKDNKTFIDMTKKERQELLYRFLDIYVFVELYDLAKEESRSNAAEIKRFASEDYVTKRKELKGEIKEINQEIKNREEAVKQNQEKLKLVNDRIDRLRSKLRPVDDRNIDEEDTKYKLSDAQSKIESTKAEQLKLDDKLRDYEVKIQMAQRTLDEFEDIESLQDQSNKLMTLQQKISDTKHKKASLDQQIDECERKIDALHNHEYDPNCKYCVQNPFVKDAKEAQSMIGGLLDQRKEFDDIIDLSEKINSDLQEISDKIKKYNDLKREIESNESSYKLHQSQQETLSSRIENLKLNIEKYNNDLEHYEKCKEDVKFNKNLQGEINHVIQEKQNIVDWIEAINDKIMDFKVDLRSKKSSLEYVNQQEEYYKELLNDHEAYDMYMKATFRDGIPYMILKKILPVITAEVNDTLMGIVDYTFELEVGEKDTIDGYIIDEGGRRIMELSSGMEQFVLSTAIRSSLVRLSDLSKPNFMAIDEGFGTLDADKLNNMDTLFGFLKKNFDFVLCITHIMQIKDYVDGVISISKVDGRSEIRA